MDRGEAGKGLPTPIATTKLLGRNYPLSPITYGAGPITGIMVSALELSSAERLLNVVDLRSMMCPADALGNVHQASTALGLVN